MNKNVKFALLVLIICIFGTIIWQLNNHKTTINNPSQKIQAPKAKTDKALGNIYPIMEIPQVNERFDETRYSCQNKKIVSEIENDNTFGKSIYLQATSVTIMPDNIKLEKADSTAKFISYTFDNECKNIYAIVQYKLDESKDIFKFNVENGKYTKLTNNLSPRWTSIDESKPSPFFIYTINNKKLLISFSKATTGLDSNTNFTIHKIFDLNSSKFTKEIEFVDSSLMEWLAPPTILNFKTNILSNAVGINHQSDGNYRNLIRKDFDLINESFITSENLDIELLNDNTKISFACPSTYKPYNECIKENIKNIFPEKLEIFKK